LKIWRFEYLKIKIGNKKIGNSKNIRASVPSLSGRVRVGLITQKI